MPLQTRWKRRCHSWHRSPWRLRTFCKAAPVTYEATVSFGEYGAPDFDSRVQTISNAAAASIMSVEAVEELWGSSKDDEWKAGEVSRIRRERGVEELPEPAVGLEV